mgnify:CR=1 FL=1
MLGVEIPVVYAGFCGVDVTGGLLRAGVPRYAYHVTLSRSPYHVFYHAHSGTKVDKVHVYQLPQFVGFTTLSVHTGDMWFAIVRR